MNSLYGPAEQSFDCAFGDDGDDDDGDDGDDDDDGEEDDKDKDDYLISL